MELITLFGGLTLFIITIIATMAIVDLAVYFFLFEKTSWGADEPLEIPESVRELLTKFGKILPNVKFYKSYKTEHTIQSFYLNVITCPFCALMWSNIITSIVYYNLVSQYLQDYKTALLYVLFTPFLCIAVTGLVLKFVNK